MCGTENDKRHLPTSITPWGRYRFKVALQGYLASGDAYSKRYDQILGESHITHNDYTKCIEDSVLWADVIEESFYRTVVVMASP